MRKLGIAAAGCALAAQVASARQAEAAPRLSPPEIERLYRAHRQAAEAWVGGKPGERPAPRPSRGKAPDTIDFVSCSVGPPHDARAGSSPEDRLERALSSRAVEAQWVRQRLRRHRFPASLYRKRLDAFEREALAGIIASYSGGRAPYSDIYDVIYAIERAREAAGRNDLPSLTVIHCLPGDRESRAVLRSEPAGATVWFMSEYHRDVCAAQRINTWNISLCRHWGASDPRQALPFYGWYQVQAWWPDGRIVRQRKRIDGAPATATGHPVYTISR